MLHKTRGIVLHQIRYSESSLIVKIFTRDLGLQSYLVKGARSKRSSMRSSLFQPMTLLDLVVYHREKNDLQHMREAALAEPFHSIASDLRRSSIALFLAEIITKTLKEGEANEDMFDFLASSLHYLDIQSGGLENFHLYFLIQYSRFLGFNPQGKPQGSNACFDLREGKFVSEQPAHSDRIEGEPGKSFYMLTMASAGGLDKLTIPKSIRDKLLNALIMYYQIHLSGLGTIKSLDVLREVFR
ncbi:MAG: DNA repair protein RecO [Bacteroidota bacterium]